MTKPQRRSPPRLHLAHSSATPLRHAPYLGLVRLDTKGRTRRLIEWIEPLFKGDPGVEGTSLHDHLLELAEGQGEIPFDELTATGAECARRLSNYLLPMARAATSSTSGVGLRGNLSRTLSTTSGDGSVLRAQNSSGALRPTGGRSARSAQSQPARCSIISKPSAGSHARL
jgi:hypothetical protein